MEKSVLISIRGIQEYPDADPDPVDLITAGQLTSSSSGYTLTYRESGVTGISSTTTTIQIRDHQVAMSRRGEVNTEMIFEAGRRHLSILGTPTGDLPIGVRTSRLTTRFDDQGGDIELDYDVEVDYTLTGRNFFRISVREPDSRYRLEPRQVLEVEDPSRFHLLQ